MTDVDDLLRPPGPRGCATSVLGFLALAVTAPAAAMIRGWRAWRRGGDVRVSVVSEDHRRPGVVDWRRLDISCDAPLAAAPVTRDRVTDVVVRIAELVRRPGDAYHLVYRLPGNDEAVALPLGPSLQVLGERFRLCLAHGPLAGRTAVWLALDRDRVLSAVVDAVSCDPEEDADRERLLAAVDGWAIAASWVRSGPSWLLRMIVVLPADAARRAAAAVESIAGP